MIDKDFLMLDYDEDNWDYPEDEIFPEEEYIEKNGIAKDVIEFRKSGTQYRYDKYMTLTAKIFINGKDLHNIIVERGMGSYAEVPANYLFNDLFKMCKEFKYCGMVILYGCDCGEPGCYPCNVTIRENNTSVVWSSFENSQFDKVPSTPMTFVFDKKQYYEALEVLRSFYKM